MENISNTDTSWKKDPSRKFYLLVLKLYKTLSEVRFADVHDYAPGASLYERNLSLYSKDYVDYMLCKTFQTQREGTEERDTALIWVTKHWRQRQSLGEVMRMTFRDQLEVAPVLELGVAAVANVLVADHLTHYTQDKFWSLINGAVGTREARFSFILILKLMVHKICLGNSVPSRQTSRLKGLTSSTMKNYIKEISDSSGHGLFHLWDNDAKLTTYLKDRIMGKKVYASNTDMNYLKTQYDRDGPNSIQKLEWNLAMRPIGRAMLIEAFENPPDTAIEYEWIQTGGSPTATAIGLALDGNNLKEAVMISSRTGVVTGRLIEHILNFRTSWQRNRRNYGRRCVEIRRNNVPDIVSEQLRNANVSLANQVGFHHNNQLDIMKDNKNWRDETV